MKKMLAASLLFTLISSTAMTSTVFAADDHSQNELSKTKKMYDSKGEEIGTKTSHAKKQVETMQDGATVISITTESDLRFKVLAKAPQHVSKTKVVKIMKNGDIWVNGRKLSQEELSVTLNPVPADGMGLIPHDPIGTSSPYPGEEGGKYHLTWYDEQGPDYFFLRAYPDADYFMDNATGSLRAKMSGGNYNVASFKTYAIDVANQRDDIVEHGLELASALMISAASLTVGEVYTALGGVGSAAWLAWQIDSASGDGHDSMANAYSSLGKI